MIRYPYLLLDADNTLFNFDAGNRNAFREVCLQCDIPYTDENFALYEACNNEMWTLFDRGECTKDFLVIERFRRFLDRLQLDRDPALCNHVHLSALAQNQILMPHAEEVCRTLAKDHYLYLVTNAVAAVQKKRLSQSVLLPYISGAFISEEAGANKPSVAYFDYVFSHVDGLTKENCIVIGDSLSSDIQGANNYGLPCCWYNPKKITHPRNLKIDFEITDLLDLYNIV